MRDRGTAKKNGNLFADIGVPNAEEHFVKAQLVFKIDSIMKARRMRQVDAASLLGIRQPDVSNMLRGESRQFSVEKLLRSWSRWGRMWRLLSGRTGTRRMRQSCAWPEAAASGKSTSPDAWATMWLRGD